MTYDDTGKYLFPISDFSDRLGLTVRMCKDGNREWLAANGKFAVVFFERGFWIGRRVKGERKDDCLTEMEALTFVLDEDLMNLRNERRKDL